MSESTNSYANPKIFACEFFRSPNSWMNFANEKCEFAENIRRIHGNLRIDSSVSIDKFYDGTLLLSRTYQSHSRSGKI